MTIRDYRPKDFVWFDHVQAAQTRKVRPAVVIRVFPTLERVVLLYGQSQRRHGAVLVPAGPESPFPGDTYFAADNVCAVTFRAMRRVSLPPKSCKTRLFLKLEELSQSQVTALTIREDLAVSEPVVKDEG
jgi:hypothetical protein